MIAFAW